MTIEGCFSLFNREFLCESVLVPKQGMSLRKEQNAFVARVRAQGSTWAEVAAAVAAEYAVNVRVAFRLAHGWSQAQVADQWNSRWPTDPKTFKNISYWEQWPSPTGYAPSLDVLARLAEIYRCRVADLVDDCADFRDRDETFRHRGDLANADSQNLLARLVAGDVTELTKLALGWSQAIAGEADRRALLLKISAATSLAAAESEMPSVGPARSVERHGDLTGIWCSEYHFPSTGRGATFSGVHHVVLRHHDDTLQGTSIAHPSGSVLQLDLAVRGAVATGTWREETSPTGYYKGAVYHGTLQMILDPSGHQMNGMWVGFGRDFKVNSGQWSLTLKDRSTIKSVQRKYRISP